VDRRLFALDHNFPEPVLAVFAEFLPFVELVPIRSIDPAWTDLDVRHNCHHTVRDRAQVWNLRVAQKNHDEVGVYLTKIAERNNTSVAELLSRNRLAGGRLGRDR